ncbi:hypothetical protein N0V91_007433 [Didymella pomorum]|uniref:Cryptic loci regulator 2 C-terminal domain-containing protein n=1 Tax=Didymella pomorum TaxID=749634 RepID=A0A9W8Z8Z8_9PLEO|nr:hypothetical protein N0V91_007433 [Didymella pomorum]
MSSPRRVVVRLRPGSDGDATHVPRNGTHEKLDPPTLYLEKIGDQWMQARGDAQPGVKYVLESLPAGYTLWQRPRPKDPKVLDKYLYGHPNGKRQFWSSAEKHIQQLEGAQFQRHCIDWLLSAFLIPELESRLPSLGSGAIAASHPNIVDLLFDSPNLSSPAQVTAGMDTTRVDEEGSPDVYRNLINRLRRNGTIDEAIEEPLSMDWRVEQELLPDLRRKIEDNPQWAPRVGDIVLYVRDLPNDVHLLQYPITKDYRMYDEMTKQWLDQPVWEAAIVSQTPTEEVTINDICENGQKQGNVTYSGVRVEPLPDVNEPDKSQSKRHKYVPIRHTRPFILWKHFLHQTQKSHPTILNAQAITATMSLTGKYRFNGAWPEASIYSRAMYLGYEMLAVGDAVRLLPNASLGQTTTTDILVIKSIRLKLSNLDNASDNDWDEGPPYKSAVWIHGAAYTSDPSRQNKEWFSDSQSSQTASQAGDEYGEWYPLHPPSKELAIPYSRVMGRLFERDAMALWLNEKSNEQDLLDAGREALIESRGFARQHDKRISDHLEANWYWADSRAQALDLHTINGLDVSSHDQLRDTKEWRKKIKVIEGMTTSKVVPTAKLKGAPGLAGRSLRGFMAPPLSDLPDLPNRSSVVRVSNTTNGSSSTGLSIKGESLAPSLSRERPSHIVNLSGDEQEDEDIEINEEIRQATRIIEDAPGVPAKRARVQVAIGRKRQV